MVPRNQLAQSWTHLAMTSTSSALFLGHLAEPAPGTHSLTITPVGCGRLRGDAWPAAGSHLCSSS